MEIITSRTVCTRNPSTSICTCLVTHAIPRLSFIAFALVSACERCADALTEPLQHRFSGSWKILACFFFRAEACHNHEQAPRLRDRVSSRCFFRVLHSSSFNKGFIKRALSKHAHVLDHACFELATSVQRKMFRPTYPFCWPRRSSRAPPSKAGG